MDLRAILNTNTFDFNKASHPRPEAQILFDVAPAQLKCHTMHCSTSTIVFVPRKFVLGMGEFLAAVAF